MHWWFLGSVRLIRLGGVILAAQVMWHQPVQAQPVNALEGAVETNVPADQAGQVQFSTVLRATRPDQPLRLVVPLIDSETERSKRPVLQVRLADIVPPQQPGTGARINIEVITLEDGRRAVELRTDAPIAGLKRIGLVVVWGNNYIKRLYTFASEPAAPAIVVPSRPAPILQVPTLPGPAPQTPPPAAVATPAAPAAVPPPAMIAPAAPTPPPVVAPAAPPAASPSVAEAPVAEPVPTPQIVTAPLAAPAVPAPPPTPLPAAPSPNVSVAPIVPASPTEPVRSEAARAEPSTPIAIAPSPALALAPPMLASPQAAGEAPKEATRPVDRQAPPRRTPAEPAPQALLSAPARDTLKVDRSEAARNAPAVMDTARKLALQEAESRAAALDEQVLKLRQMLTLQDRKIAQAQASAAEEPPTVSSSQAPPAARPVEVPAPAVVPTPVGPMEAEPLWQRFGLAIALGVACLAGLFVLSKRRKSARTDEQHLLNSPSGSNTTMHPERS